MPIVLEPRPPNDAETAVLAHILAADFPGATELRPQIDLIQVIAQWQPDSTSVDFRAAGPIVRSPHPDGPIEATVVSPAGEEIGEILIWVVDGVLAALEHAWWTDAMPTVLPAPDRLRV